MNGVMCSRRNDASSEAGSNKTEDKTSDKSTEDKTRLLDSHSDKSPQTSTSDTRSNISQFKAHFRMNRDTAYQVIEWYENSRFYPKTAHSLATSVSAENHVLSFIWFGANKSCLRDVSQRFGIGLTTLFRQIERVMEYLGSIAPTVIQFPKSAEDKAKTEEEFAKVSGFPGVLGCIDGTSIGIRTPAHKIKSTYTNRHDLPAITLQAICNSNRKFTDVFTGAPGKIHDARVYKLSDISEVLPLICEKKYHILGDGAYSLREWLLTPYKDYGNLTEDHTKFNKKFSATRVLIENSFGILKGRFRQLLELHLHSVDKITKFIIACCVLHNLCIDNDDLIEELVEEDELFLDNVDCNDAEVALRRRGELKRDAIKNSLDYI